MFVLATAVSMAGIQQAAFCAGDDDPMTAPDGAPNGSKDAPPAAPKAKRPPRGDGGNGGTLAGPKVPDDAGKGDSSFGTKEGKNGKAGQRQQMQGGMMEARLFMESMKSVEPMLSDDQRTKVEAIRESFMTETNAWREVNGEKLKAMEEKMGGMRGGQGGGKGGKGGKPPEGGPGEGGPGGGGPGAGGPGAGGPGASGPGGGGPGAGGPGAGGKPDKAAMEEMQKLRATMPNFETARDQIMAVLTPDQQAEVKSNMAAARKEMEKRGVQGKGGQGGKGKGGKGGPDGKTPPPADPPKGDYKFPD